MARAPVPSASAEGVDTMEPPTLAVQNVVLTAYFGGRVNLGYVVERLAHMGPEFNGRRFCAAVFRQKFQGGVETAENTAFLGALAPRARPGFAAPAPDIPLLHHLIPRDNANLRTSRIAFLLFPNCRVVLTGARSVLHARQILEGHLSDLHSIGYTDLQLDYDMILVRNMVGCATLGIPINLARLAERLPLYVTYDQTAFPGASIRQHPLCGPATLLVFKSGCIVVTGICSKAIGDEVLARISPLLRAFEIGLPDDYPIPGCDVDDLAPLGVDDPWKMTAPHKEAYQELDLEPTCTTHEVVRRRRLLLRKLHPDKHANCPPESLAARVLKDEGTIVAHCADLLANRTARYEYNRTGSGMLSEESCRRDATHFIVLELILLHKFYPVAEDDVDGPEARAAIAATEERMAASSASAAAAGQDDDDSDGEAIEDGIDDEIAKIIDEMEDVDEPDDEADA